MGTKFEQKAKYFNSDVLSTVSIVLRKLSVASCPAFFVISTGTTKAFVKYSEAPT